MLREILARFGFEVDSKNLDAANNKISGVLGNLVNLKGAFAGALAGIGLGLLKGQIDDLAKESGEINKAAIKAGVGFEQFQKIGFVTGLSTEQLTMTFRNLQLGMAAAKGEADDTGDSLANLAEGGLDKIGKKKAGDALKKLGVDMRDTNKVARSSADVFQDTLKGLAGIDDPAKQSALAIQIFGRSGQDILPMLHKSPEALKELGDAFDTIGGLTESNRKDLALYIQQQKILDLALTKVKTVIIGTLVPAFTWLFQKLNQGVMWFKKTVDTTQLLTAGFAVVAAAAAAFGGASAVAAISAVAAWASVALPLIVAALLIDDLIHFFNGDAKTATEDFIKLIFGEQAGESWIKQVRADLHAFIEDITGAKDKIQEVKDLLGFITGGGVIKAEQGILGAEDVQVASRGITRKAKRRATAASAEAGVEGGQGTRQDIYGPSLEEGGKSLYQPQPTTIPVPASAKGINQTIDVKNTTNVVQNITGADAQDAADQSVEGIKKQAEKDRRATQAALTVRK